MKAVVIALTLASALGYTAPALRPRASLAPAARVRATSPAPLTAQSAVVAPLTPTIAEARAFELVRGTHFALFSLLAGLELIPTLLIPNLRIVSFPKVCRAWRRTWWHYSRKDPQMMHL